MLASKAVGRDAATKKYDLLTALSTFALSADKGTQRLVLRLQALITARYNWRRNELSMGRKEIARIWSVDERTVKREMAKLRNLDWVRVKIPAARGRVAVYSIEFAAISKATEAVWPLVGPDFVERMSAMYPQSDVKVVKVDFGGPKAAPETEVSEAATPSDDRSRWRAVRGLLRDADSDVFRNWFENLDFQECEGGALVLLAPNKFVASYIETHLGKPLLGTTQQVYEGITSVRIETAG